MINGNEIKGLLGSLNTNREYVLLVKRKGKTFKIVITLVLALVFPLVLFWSNLEHLINLGLHALEHSKVSISICNGPGTVTLQPMLSPTTSLPTYSSTTSIPIFMTSYLKPILPSFKILGEIK